MLAALREIARLEPRLTTPVTCATWLRVQTQVFMVSVGFVDMVLTLGDERSATGEVWLEAKIDSAEGVEFDQAAALFEPLLCQFR